MSLIKAKDKTPVAEKRGWPNSVLQCQSQLEAHRYDSILRPSTERMIMEANFSKEPAWITLVVDYISQASIRHKLDGGCTGL